MDKQSIIEVSKESYQELLEGFQSVNLGTVSSKGIPEVSYTPAVMDQDRVFYVYVSELSAHTGNMLSQNMASLMVIEGEESCEQIFARGRVTFQCQVSEIDRDSDQWKKVTLCFIDKFGKMFEHLMGMGDFHLLELRPKKGRLVVGFGRAFDLTGEKMDELRHIKGQGKGHGHAPGAGQRSPKVKVSSGEPSLSAETVKGMIEHMNDDHADSVLLYAHHYSGKTDTKSAVLKDVTTRNMRIEIDGGESVNINFPHVLKDSNDAHMTMVQMSKEARRALG